MAQFGGLLGRAFPDDSNASVLLVPDLKLGVEITRVVACNVAPDETSFCLFHVPAGVTLSGVASETRPYALYWNRVVQGATAFVTGDPPFIYLNRGDELWVKPNAGSTLVFFAYGRTQQVALPGRLGSGYG